MGRHANAPLTPEGRRRLIDRIVEDGRPISHVADEAGVSRQRLGVWYRRWLEEGDAGLEDRSSRPLRSPNITSDELGDHGSPQSRSSYRNVTRGRWSWDSTTTSRELPDHNLTRENT